MCIIAYGFHSTLYFVPFYSAVESLLYGKPKSGNPIDNIKERGWDAGRKGPCICLELLLSKSVICFPSVFHTKVWRSSKDNNWGSICRADFNLRPHWWRCRAPLCDLTGQSAKQELRPYCLLLKHCLQLPSDRRLTAGRKR